MKPAIKITIGIILLLSAALLLTSVMLPSLSRARELSTRTGGRSRYLSPSAGRSGVPSSQAEALPGSLPSLHEEVWIIKRYSGDAAMDRESAPRCGMLTAHEPLQQHDVPLPLEHTDVHAAVAGYIATVDLTQQYRNPFDRNTEAVYVFPLPQNAAVSSFLMRIGERRIRGVIRERDEAERLYREAKAQGQLASLLTQERPNVFTQAVANIEPGKPIDIEIRYFHTLACVDGWYEFIFPLVVGPRFNPPGSRNGIGAVAREQSGTSGQRVEVEYLQPEARSSHDVTMLVDISAGVAIEAVRSPNHGISVQRPATGQIKVVLSPLDALPNRDFVLRYRLAGKKLNATLIADGDDDGGYFTLMVHPPHDVSALARGPMEMVFVLDCSGSMSGRPIEQAKNAVERALRHLGAEDTFQIIRFSSRASQLGTIPVPATEANTRQGLRYLRSLRGGGGTMMIEGIKAALAFPHDPRRLRVVTFLTDGFIGNEIDILREVHVLLGESRIFSFGVGSSPNRYLLERMAKIGRGAVAYLGLHDSAADVMDCFWERVSRPAMTDVCMDWGDATVSELFPTPLPDLFAGRAVTLTGRYQGNAPTTVKMRGWSDNREHAIDVLVDTDDASGVHEAVRFVWARMKIAHLYDQAARGGLDQASETIRQLALEHGLMSAWTAFVSVDTTGGGDSSEAVTVPVAVSVPDGVRYDRTVPGS